MMSEGQKRAMQSSSFVIWKTVMRDGFCVCEGLEKVEDTHELKRGASMADRFPADARFSMDPDYPKDIKLGDTIRNDDGLILVSKRLKETIEAGGIDKVEFLQVTIINHKGRLASTEYFIVNPVEIRDAIDLHQSDVQWNAINPNLISSCSRLVLDDEKIDPNLKMWRLKFFPRRVLVRRDLADAILTEQFTGVAFTEVADFSGF
jgi:hypothetical protein